LDVTVASRHRRARPVATTWRAGRSLRRAADMVEIIERSAKVILGCYAVGKPPSTLTEEVVRTLQKMGDLLA
jgi:ribulose-5-phosphate 4-epimerase/fuculose-1-phosphate aldolase